MKDKVEERKEKDEKPIRLFSINGIIFSDGVVASQLIEYARFGRLKNQKVLYTGADAGKDFLSVVRGLLPSAIPYIEDLVMHIEKDSEVEDTIDTEKIAKFTVDLYNNSFLDLDLSEIIKKSGPGAPKAWRKEPKTFITDLKFQVGNLVDVFKPLLEVNTTSRDTSSTVKELTQLPKTGGYVREDDIDIGDYDQDEDQDLDEEDNDE